MSDRVLIVTPWYLPLLGGQERQVALLAAEFARRGHEVDVITELADPGSPRREDDGRIHVRRIGPRGIGRRGPLRYLWLAAELSWLLVARRRRYRFAVVRTLTLPAVVSGLLKALRLLPYPTLTTAETGGDEDDVVALRGYPAFALLRRLLSAHDRLNSICAENLDHYRELGFPDERLAYVLNGVTTDGYEQRAYPARVRTFGFLGRLHPEKGVVELLEAFGRLVADDPGLRLVLAGAGPAEAQLRELAAPLGEAVRFVGRIPYDELGEFFEAIDCLVLPSYSEGLPLSVLEAAAHKRALVTTDVGDLRELFGDAIDIAAKRDVGDLVRALRAAMARTPGSRDYDSVVERVSIATTAREIERILTATAAAA